LNRKNNFLITVTQENGQQDLNVNPDLPNHYSINTGNLNITLRFSENTVFAKSNDENIILLLSGYIYQDDLSEYKSIEDYLLNKYSKYKKDFVKHLNGYFCLFFAQKDSGEVYIATDRLNARKLYKYEKGNKLIFSTEISYLPLNECKISYAGAACYLINSILLNDLTIFDEIKKIERASLHKIVNLNVISEQYWDYKFTNEYENRPVEELSEELHELYLKSIKRIIAGKKNIFISLSGGYDSRGIAAMLKNISGSGTKIICVSHNFGEDIKNTDADIARLTAEQLGYEFRLINSYNGDPFHTLKNNAEIGQGISGFCTESDAWEQFNNNIDEYENSIFLTGDMYDGTYVDFHGNAKRALEKARICEPSFLNDFKQYFSSETYKNMYESWGNEYQKILDKVSPHKNMVNLLDYLYMDQLIPNLYGTQRESFHMPFIETAFPFYDNDILDYIQKITPELRDRKKIHKIILEKYYPETFGIDFPDGGWGNEPAWSDEIINFSGEFIDDINNRLSKLDEIMPPKAIIDSILSLNEGNTNIYKRKTALSKVHKTLKKIIPDYHRLIEKLPGGDELTRKAGKFVNPRITHHPLVKILILRLYLSEN
jgi:asparagine synthase (glutamine-hydrolysing)